MKQLFFAACLFFSLTVAAQKSKTASAKAKKNSISKKNTTKTAEHLVEITTPYGNIVVKLYNETPLHRDNFIRLVKEGFYDSLLFHRVIDSFMIQGGDPESRHAADSVVLGEGEAPGERIPAEFNKALFHKKGALAMARDDNPEKTSSNCQFYIVQGKPFNDSLLNKIECNIRNSDISFSFTEEQRNIYRTIGGTPFLDQNYTVFGEVVKGLDVVDKIAALATDSNDRPLQNVRMKVLLLN